MCFGCILLSGCWLSIRVQRFTSLWLKSSRLFTSIVYRLYNLWHQWARYSTIACCFEFFKCVWHTIPSHVGLMVFDYMSWVSAFPWSWRIQNSKVRPLNLNSIFWGFNQNNQSLTTVRSYDRGLSRDCHKDIPDTDTRAYYPSIQQSVLFSGHGIYYRLYSNEISFCRL